MTTRITTCLAVTVLAAALVPAFGQNQKSTPPEAPQTKEAIHEAMRSLGQEVDLLRSAHGSAYEIERIQAEIERLSALLGGDLPARTAARAARGASPAPTPTTTGGTQSVVAPPCSPGVTTTNFPGTTGVISPPIAYDGITFTTNVAGAGAFLWDLNLNTAILHPSSGELDITLESPAGTIVTITTDNGGTLDNNFNGTAWDDNSNDPVTDRAFVNNVPVSPLSPEGRLQAFRGEDPNGIWKLRVYDDGTANVGSVTSWSLDVSTLASAPSGTTTNLTASPGTIIPPTAPPIILTENLIASGLGTYLSKVELYVEITHTFGSDLDITLTSPAGTVVTVTTDNAGSNDNTFNGTLFNPSATDTVTDHVYTTLVVAPLLSPEGAFDNFLGQDPNGTWTMTVSDDANLDGGVIVRWDLNLTTIAVPSPSAPANVAGVGGAIPDFSGGVTPVPSIFTANVAAGTFLWDVDLNTLITHTAGADLDMTLTSPAGTIVVISTDNGGTNDNVFNGTLWDDNANDPAVDHAYSNGVPATPLSPEGRVAAFRGENPNGTWTLSITDDAAADNGNMNGWSLDISTLPAGPSETSTTYSQSPGLNIPSTAPPIQVSDVIAASGLGAALTEVELYLEITHTFAGDLDITLTSAAGSIVQVTSDNGAGSDNVFNGTLFDGDVLDPVTDHVYTTGVVVPLLAPEGSFDFFVGENPNGNWTLTVNDDANLDGGTVVRWDLTLRTCAAVTSFCFGDGSGTACPCANAGAAGNGCASSVNANGANLTATGTASIGNDTVVLLGSGMPNSSALYFQGTSQLNGGLGNVFGDGLRCAGGSIIRLGTKANQSGASQYPSGADPSVSVRGNDSAGDVRTYQIWYRNAAAFCTAATFNLSNGIQLTWLP